MKRPALLRRFPTLRGAFASYPIVDAETAAKYPALHEDIAAAEEVIGPAFKDSDLAALREQNRYRRQQVVIILGTALLSGLGGLQAVFPAERWPGILLSLLGIILTFAGRTAGELRTFDTFLDQRIKAERLRSAYFRYLSGTGRYSTQNRKIQLRRAVVAIKQGEEPT